MPTEKVYWADADRTELESTIVSAIGDRVVLDRTIFYPEGGGQLGDTGVLSIGGRELRVKDTQIEDGTIMHVLDHPLEQPITGAAKGRIDVERRRDHMAHHTAQHMLSRALLDEARAKTVSARLGATECTIDVERATVPEADLARAEDVVNDAIRRDVVVRAFFPTDEELETLDLRRAPKVDKGVRIVEVEGFDLTPCGGTHVARTGRIGLARISGVERYKGMTRITFGAAKRALVDARTKETALLALAREFSCGPDGVGAAVGKLRGDLKARGDALAAARGELVHWVAQAALAAHPPDPSGTTKVELVRPHDDISMLRTLAGKLAERVDIVAIVTAPDPAGGEDFVVVQRGACATFDCAAWLKSRIAERGGRGGGKPDRAEGRLARV
jgi:alanyl-tRNA synthetase